MRTTFEPTNERGHVFHGWLDTYHSFSFASWYNPEKIHFGALRVLNDDFIEVGTGFGSHPHDNMEVISIPLKGALAHKDSTGSEEITSTGMVQVMSAGTGIVHSEYNGSETEKTNFLQIWIFPKKDNIKPRYEQKAFDEKDRKGKWQILVSPREEDKALWINQDAVLSRIDLKAGDSTNYNNHFKGNGVYVFVLEGSIEINGQIAEKRDAIGVSETDSFEIKVLSDAQILTIEVPMITVEM
jgi:redox-sensitive bicupin YhaK (pirin superfamily)